MFAPVEGNREHPVQSGAGLMHQTFDEEPIDPNWSSNVEANAKAYFAARPSAEMIDVVSLDCRATICEILAAGKSAGVPMQGAVEQWQQSVFTGPMQNWWAAYGLVDMFTAISQTDDGRFIAATYFTKKPVKSQTPIQY